MSRYGSFGPRVSDLYLDLISSSPPLHPRYTSYSSKLDLTDLPVNFNNETMDFSKFRDTGELSDISVVVDGKEFLLHKFPLFIKSDFFRALARSPKGESIKLDEFPGGPEVFAEVANYFYNVKLTLNKSNVCQLRCAAEFLQMTSPGNLSSLADRVLQDTLTSAKLGHKFDVITDLITQCRSLGAIAEQAGVVEKCINAIVDCWLISPKFSRRYTLEGKFSNDDEAIKLLGDFPLDWYKLLCVTAREKSIRPTVLANLIQSYISHAVDSKYGDKSEDTTESENSESDEEEKIDDDKSSDDNSELDEKAKPEAKPEAAKEDIKKDETKTKIEENEKPASNPDLDTGKVMDTLLFEVPLDSPVMVESFCHSWVIQMLKIAQEVGCDSKEVLLILAGKMMYRYSKDDLAGLPADILSQIIAEGCKDNRANPDDLCRVLYGYLMDQAAKDKLSIQTFQKLVDAIPKDSRASHDMLFNVLETLLKSDNISVDDKQKQDLLETVDFSRLSESTLQRAYDSGLVPGAYVTKAALTLCTKLRSDLDAAKVIIRDQELRLERYGITPGAGTAWLKSVDAGSAGRQKAKSTDFPDYDTHFPPRSSHGGATPSLASDYELKMALDSLDRSMDRTVDCLGSTDAAPTPTTPSKALHYGSYYTDHSSDEKPFTSSYLWNQSYSKYSSN